MHDFLIAPTHQRQRIEWNIHRKTGNKKSVRNLTFMSELQNPNIPVLEKVFFELIDRHESLRTTFCISSGHLKQKIHTTEKINPRIEHFDLTGNTRLPGFTDRKKRESQIITQLIQLAVDLEKGPLFKCALLNYDNVNYKLIFSANHIIIDANSINILQREFTSLYTAYLSNEVPDLYPMEYQLKDYASWESNFFSQDQGQENLAYWDAILSKPFQKLSLNSVWKEKTDRFPFSFNEKKSRYQLAFPVSEMRKIKVLTKKQHSSSLTFYLSSLYLFYYFLSGQRDLMIASQISLRNNEIAKNLVGYLTTGIYLRFKIPTSITVKDLLELVRDKYMEALEHRNYSMEELQIPVDQICPIFINYFPNQASSQDSIENFKPRFIKGELIPYYPFNFTFQEFNNGFLVQCHQKKEMSDRSQIPLMFQKYRQLVKTMLDFPASSTEEVIQKLSLQT